MNECRLVSDYSFMPQGNTRDSHKDASLGSIQKEGEDPLGTILLDQGKYPEGKECQYHEPDTDNCKEGITSTG